MLACCNAVYNAVSLAVIVAGQMLTPLTLLASPGVGVLIAGSLLTVNNYVKKIELFEKFYLFLCHLVKHFN